jgi:hypothetical protein
MIEYLFVLFEEDGVKRRLLCITKKHVKLIVRNLI